MLLCRTERDTQVQLREMSKLKIMIMMVNKRGMVVNGVLGESYDRIFSCLSLRYLNKYIIFDYFIYNN